MTVTVIPALSTTETLLTVTPERMSSAALPDTPLHAPVHTYLLSALSDHLASRVQTASRRRAGSFPTTLFVRFEAIARGFMLRAWPPALWGIASLRDLLLEGHALSALPKEFLHLLALRSFSSVHCGIRSVPPDWRSLKALSSINLGFNALSGSGWAHVGSALVSLAVAHNPQLSALPEIGVGEQETPQLHSIDASFCKLTALPASLGTCFALSRIDVSHNVIKSVDCLGALDTATPLRELCLSHNRIGSLPDGLGKLTALVLLDVSHNVLTALPDSFSGLVSLQSIDVSNNRLVGLAPLASCTALQTVSAANNVIEALDPLVNLTKLESIDLSNNSIAAVPAALVEQPRLALRVLCLANNALRELPDAMGHALPKIQVLDVSGNSLVTVPESIGGLSTLTTLRLASTLVCVLPTAVPQGLRMLSFAQMDVVFNGLPTPLPADADDMAVVRTDPVVIDDDVATVTPATPENTALLLSCARGPAAGPILLAAVAHLARVQCDALVAAGGVGFLLDMVRSGTTRVLALTALMRLVCSGVHGRSVRVNGLAPADVDMLMGVAEDAGVDVYESHLATWCVGSCVLDAALQIEGLEARLRAMYTSERCVAYNPLRGSVRRALHALGAADAVHFALATRATGPGVRILALDGGGTRGLVTLAILEELEERTGKRVHEMFDLIVGTSTGAIIAGFLGIRKMSVTSCRARYLTFAKKVFHHGRQTELNMDDIQVDDSVLDAALAKEAASQDGMRAGANNDDELLEEIMENPGESGWAKLFNLHRILKTGGFYSSERLGSIMAHHITDQPLMDSTATMHAPCVAFCVVNVDTLPAQPHVFRNYCLPPLPEGAAADYKGASHIATHRAIQASTAAPGLFATMELDELPGERYQDGGILVNNPSAVALREARRLFPTRAIDCLLSVGTGTGTPKPAQYDGIRGIAMILAKGASSPDRIADCLHDAMAMVPNIAYARLSPLDDRLQCPLNEARDERLTEMQVAAKEAMQRFPIKDQLDRFGSIL